MTANPTMPSDTSLLHVLRDFEEQGYRGQFQAAGAEGVRCLTCRSVTAATSVDADRMVRLEGVSDPADMLAILPVRCPACSALGVLVCNYGPESTLEEVELLLSVERSPRAAADRASDPTASASEQPWPALVARLGRNRRIGAVERALRRRVAPVVGSPAVRRVLGSDGPLGDPVHPTLTDLPVGFWTSALVIDAGLRRRGAPAARLMVALGVASAVPTVISGLSDYAAMPQGPSRRVAVVHAGANLAATGLYALSWVARRRDRWLAGVALSTAGAGVATFGGALGGSLAFDEAPTDGP